MGYFGIPFRNGVPIGLGSIVGFGAPQEFSPSELFLGGTAGTWYDPSDPTTLFTTSAGTTQCAMPGQGSAVSVGLMLDKSQGLVLGSTVVVNGDFSQGSTGWTLGGSAAVSGGQLVFPDGVYSQAQQLPAGYANNWYLFEFDLTITSGSFFFRPNVASSTDQQTFTTSGRKSFYARVTASGFEFFTLTGNGIRVDNVSIRAVPGNHAIAFNYTTARPELSARVNQLLNSQNFSGAAWTVDGISLTASAGTAPDGTNTATSAVLGTGGNRVYQFDNTGVLGNKIFSIYVKPNAGSTITITATGGMNPSGVAATINASTGVVTGFTGASSVPVGNGWYRIFLPVNVISASGNSTYWVISGPASSVFIWGAQLVSTNQFPANTYQRIADQYTYDSNGFPSYLRFDGVDDSMYTPANLNLSGTDKVSVFAGVRRNATVTQFPVEFSSSDSNNGSFGIGADSGGAEYFFNSRGTTLRQIVVDNAAYNAPVSNVATLSADIAAPSMIARLNGTQVGSNTGSQGTGNFGTYPLYIGSRNNSTFFLNGHLYSLIIAGSAVSAGNISATEQWVAGKVGITI